jgi:hypothetical protein
MIMVASIKKYTPTTVHGFSSDGQHVSFCCFTYRSGVSLGTIPGKDLTSMPIPHSDHKHGSESRLSTRSLDTEVSHGLFADCPHGTNLLAQEHSIDGTTRRSPRTINLTDDV